MTLWQRIKAACLDQRGQWDPGGLDPDVGSYSGGEMPAGPSIPSGVVDPTTGSGGPSFPSLQNFGDFAKSVLPLLQVGTAGLGAVTGVEGAINSAKQTKLAQGAAQQQKVLSQQAQTAAAPVAGFSAQELQAAQQGQIPTAVQAQIDQWRRGARQQAMDYAARSGQGDSQTLTSWLSWIDQQAQAMAAASLQQEEQIGVQAGGTAGSILSAASGAAGGQGNLAASQAGGITDLIASANQVLARLNAAAA